MKKCSRSAQQRFSRIGSGSSFNLVYRMPKPRGKLPQAPQLSHEAKTRLRVVDYARAHSISQAARHFGFARATVQRWVQRFDPNDLRSLETRSSRPRTVRQPTWTLAQVEAVRQLRETVPWMGKDRLAVLLGQAGIPLSVSMIGRILRYLKQRRLLIEPPRSRRIPVVRAARPHAVRKPTDYQPQRPGDLVQVDTLHLRPLPGMERRQFTAVDVVSRYSAASVRGQATAGTAAAFLDELIATMPFPVRAIQVDGGSEFMAQFETACAERDIPLFVLPPRSPKLNGRVERLQRTYREEFWNVYDGELDLPTLQQALRRHVVTYNHWRPHQALGYQTPAAFAATFPQV